jgi:hypothetical protein
LLSLHPLLIQSFRWSDHCLGYLHNDQMIMDYLESALDAATASRIPLFTSSSATAISHEDINGISFLDVSYANFLDPIIEKVRDIFEEYNLDRGREFRETVIRYFEQNLRNMWITLPPRIQKRFLHWQRSLEINSK